MNKLREIFGDKKVVGLAGEKSSGKTNNLMALVEEFRKGNKETPIFVYGLNEKTLKWVTELGNVFEISSLKQLRDKENCLIILEEFQKLNLNDRRYKDVLNEFIDFIYHNNNWVLFSSPSLREFNSVIGSKIERWVLKSLRVKDLINGSQLKDVVVDYKGRFKVLGDIRLKKNQMLSINEECENIIEVDYITKIDGKKLNINIFEI